jgi:hypothetical protein
MMTAMVEQFFVSDSKGEMNGKLESSLPLLSPFLPSRQSPPTFAPPAIRAAIYIPLPREEE